MKRTNCTNRYLGLFTVLGTTTLSLLAQEKPNVILILADDMGYSDIGCYGGEIETPNLDSLAQQGIRYSHFYNGARSCPTRAALMTGLYAHQAGIGWMTNAHESINGAYEGDLSKNALTIGEYLKQDNYKTYMIGKWHLTSYRKVNHKVKDNWPLQRGFDEFYGIVGGAANYFTTPVNIGNADGVEQSTPGFYFTDAISDQTAEFIRNNGDDPFFMYVAYNAPHWPLHAKTEDIAKYDGKYSVGWDQIRANRFDKQKAMGLFDDSYHLTVRDSQVVPWEDVPTLTGGDRNNPELWEKRMEIYAAQIDAMDQGIGRIVQALEETGKLENTIIFFLSDNGACAEALGSDDLANMTGAASTYESYRRHWANVSSTPFREYKHHAHEGGINTPLIVHWPNGIKNGNGRFVRTTGHIIDIYKTIADITNIDYPGTYQGNTIHPLQGESLLPDFQEETKVRGPMFWEHEGNLAVRIGEWKLVVKTLENQPLGKLELYNISADPVEENDLTNTNPEKLQELWEIWHQWALDKNVYPIRNDGYDKRQMEDKRYPNGTFDEYHKAGWNPAVGGNSAIARWEVDETNQITGNNSARINVLQTGTRPADFSLRWTNLHLKQNERCKVRFKAKADKELFIKLRLEKDGDGFAKVIDEDVTIGTEIKQYEYDSNVVPADFKYQIGFYAGHCPPSTIWIDDVELSFINEPGLSPEWTLEPQEEINYKAEFKAQSGYSGIEDHPVPVKIRLKRKNNPQSIFHSEEIFLSGEEQNFSIELPTPESQEIVYIEFEFPPYAARKCLIKELTLKTDGMSSLQSNKTNDYLVNTIGHAVLIKHLQGNKNYSVEMFDSSGKLLGKYINPGTQLIIPVIDSGVYLLKINEGLQTKKIKKIVL
ncbi:MAG TPA: sulfatase-like hydrolase/transferase [Paludibacter sp.]|nr:MAG: Arylsulfatase [Bacteroidetes bacterium ADurb.Bin174]HQB27404.1 sulfatase-like hydrolase/transferase [Paludibacter sp.]